MKKILCVLIAFSLIMGMMIGFESASVTADNLTINCTPKNGETVPLLSGNVYTFAANYERGIVTNLFKSYTDLYQPAPLRISWTKISGGVVYYIKIGTKANLSDAITIITKTGADFADIEDLYVGQDYYYEVSCTVSGKTYSSGIIKIKTANLPRTVNIENVHNTRDIGGCYTSSGRRVKQGVLFRGARLDDISDDAKDKMLKTFKIKSVLDLRDKPIKTLDGAKYISIPLAPAVYQYKAGLQRQANWPTIKKEVQVFADSGNFPLYVHCNLGRDRTGTICFLIEALIGMSKEDIYRDYELTFFDGLAANADVADPAKYSSTNFDPMYEYISDLYTTGTLQDKVTRYMKECLGISQNEINQIKENLLEKLPEPTTVPKTTANQTVSKPAKVVIKSAKNSKKKSIVIQYNKAKNAKGYQVCWANSKAFSKMTKKFTTGLTYTIKKLKKGKTYYLKVRAYNLKGTTKVFGAYSKVKKVKIKK